MMKSSPFLFVLFLLGFLFTSYNLVTTTIHNQSRELSRELSEEWSKDHVVQMLGKFDKPAGPKRPFHVAVTAENSPYSKWQCRIMYYWYKKIKGREGSEMGGFTRVLHSGRRDDLMDEIPTFVAEPLPKGVDMGYVVLNRPWAFVQWLSKAKIEEEYILMAEPDHIFVNPLPNLAHENYPAAYKFLYIQPDENEKILRKYYPEEMGPVTNIDPIGNSPVIIQKSLLEKIAPTWMNVSIKMNNDADTSLAFGWVLEMYGYAVASALHGVHHILHEDFMIQPPGDLNVGKARIIHYTYPCDYTLKGEPTDGKFGEWRFDKRSYLRLPPPRNISSPPLGVPESVVTLVQKLNEATANIPRWDSKS